MIYTEKQQELLKAFKDKQLKRINILHGSVRSGKTWISLVLWAFWVAASPKDKNYLMVAKTLTALKRNCLDLLESLVGKNNFTYSIGQKEGMLFGRKIYLEGVNDARAESKIRGMTLQGAYCDELTLFTEDFFSMLLSRLSERGAKLFGTTNPDSPNHWIKTNYIDRQDELDLFIMQFLIEDNTTLDPKYVESLKKEYVGVFYNRFILGQWVIAEGLVHPMFDKKRHVVDECPEPKDEYFEYYISIDYGTINPCSMGLWRVERERAIRIKELYFDSRKKKHQATDEEYYSMLEELAGDKLINCVIVDPSAASFIETVRRHGKFSVRKANNDVLDGIRVTGTLLQNGKILIHSSCEDAIREFGIYRWDEDSTEDRVIKEFDHAMDDIRYFCNTILKKRLR
jgi:PBSX family phage terminase large subunit